VTSTTSTFRQTASTSAPWLRFVLRRTGRLLVSLVVLVTATFAMIHLVPGDPVRASLGPTAPEALVQQTREHFGLDDPLRVQYADYVGNLVRGDLGESLITRQPVSQIVRDRLPATLQLAGLAFVVTMLLALPTGILAAVLTQQGRRRKLELGFTSTSTVLATIPEYLFAVGLVFVFAVSLGWVPVAGRGAPDSYVLPVLALALGPAAALARLIRVEMLQVLRTDYMRTARGKRLSKRLLYVRHALPNALTSALTIGGLLLGGLVGGTVLVEIIFAWPGLGAKVVGSVLQKDYAVVQTLALLLGALVLVLNFLVDLALGLLDPRSTIRQS
jgi:peptide/nickel transport system permease protein